MIIMDQNAVSWVDNFYDKFEAFRLEVEENMYQGPVKYVEDQMKTVGDCVKKFCSDVKKDLENLADDEVSWKSEVNTKNESLKIESNQLSKKDSFSKKLYSKVKKELADLADDDISEKPQANISRIIVKVDSCATPQVKNTDADDGLLFIDCRVKNEELSRSHLKHNDHAEINFGVMDNSQQMALQYETSVPRVSQASDLSEASIEGTSTESTGDGIETGNATDDAVEVYDQQGMIKLGESCVVVDKTEQVTISDLQGQRRSYKKKIKDVVLYPRRWAKKSKQLGLFREPIEPAGRTSGRSSQIVVSGSIIRSGKTESQTEESCDLEWELI